MAVLEILSVALEVPELTPGVQFYADAGLEADIKGDVAQFTCKGRTRSAITLIGGKERKRLHHIALRADDLDGIALKTPRFGGAVIEPPAGTIDKEGLWNDYSPRRHSA